MSLRAVELAIEEELLGTSPFGSVPREHRGKCPPDVLNTGNEQLRAVQVAHTHGWQH